MRNVRFRVICSALALLAFFCATGQAAVPKLVGTYTGSGTVISLKYGYYDATLTLTIQDQKNDLFKGTLRFVTAGADMTFNLTGAIRTDKTVFLNIKEGGSGKATDTIVIGKYIAGAKARIEGNFLCLNAETGSAVLYKKK